MPVLWRFRSASIQTSLSPLPAADVLRPLCPSKLATFSARTLMSIEQQVCLARTLGTLTIDAPYPRDSYLSFDRHPCSILCLKFSLPEAGAFSLAGFSEALNERVKGALLDWIPFSSRLCEVRLGSSSKINSRRSYRRNLLVSAREPKDCSPDVIKNNYFKSYAASCAQRSRAILQL